MWRIYYDILMAFMRAGVLGYGGGPSSIPLVQIEVVNNYGWMTIEEFAEVVALSNALPGPITTKMAGYIGYRVAGLGGAFVALVGIVGPTFIAMILLYRFIDFFRGNPYIGGMIKAIKPLVIVLLLMLVLDMFPKSMVNAMTYIVAAASFVAMNYFNVPAAIVVVATLAFGAIFMR
ncbi:MAG: chromate transporter [bacterium]|nr:chromate transporter [bacterium]